MNDVIFGLVVSSCTLCCIFDAVTAAADQGITKLYCNFDEIILSFLVIGGRVSE